jgi:hypothetical protein
MSEFLLHGLCSILNFHCRHAIDQVGEAFADSENVFQALRTLESKKQHCMKGGVYCPLCNASVRVERGEITVHTVH